MNTKKMYVYSVGKQFK